MEYNIYCQCGYAESLTGDEFYSRLGEHNTHCPDCNKELSVRGEVSLTCFICDDEWFFSGLNEGALAVDSVCAHCESNGIGEDSWRILDTMAYWRDCYRWAEQEADTSPLRRFNREDYWEGLIHFCEQREFVGILQDGMIRASPTGKFKLPAVCLTEATASAWSHLQHLHGDFGFLFRKKDIIRGGGGPVSYLTDTLIESQMRQGGFSPDVRPFIQLLRPPTSDQEKKAYDFLHEREWRLPCDLNLNEIAVQAVIMSDPSTKEMYKAGLRYGVIEPAGPFILEEPISDPSENPYGNGDSPF